MPYIGNTTSDFSINTGNITNRAVTALKLSPSSVGSNGQVLSVDGSGNLQWSADASGTALTGSTDNTITTVTGANAIQGEANLTFNNSVLSIINTSNLGDAFLYIKAGEAGASVIELQADEADDNNDLWRIQNGGDSKLGFRSKESGSWIEKLGIAADGNTTFAGSLIISENNALHFKGTYADDLDSILRENSGNALLINSRNDAIVNIDSNADSTDAHFAVAHGAATSSSNELFRVQENGKVGIGTTNPSFKLQIQGTDNAGSGLYLYNSTGAEGIKIVPESNGNCRIYSSTADALALGTNSTDRITMAADGSNIIFSGADFGFGTTPGGTPAGKNVFIAIGDSDTGIVQDGDGQLELWANATEVANINAIDGYTSTKRVYTTGTGRFGPTRINSTTESADGAFDDLVIGDYSGNRGISILSGATAQGAVGFGKSGTTADGYLAYVHNGTATSSAMTLKSQGHIKFNAGSSTKLYIEHDGKVGIGDISPDCILHVNAGAADDALKLESTDNAVNLILTDAACYSSIQQNNDMLNINSDPGSTVSASTIRFNIDGVNVGTFLNNQFRLGSNSAGIQFNGDTAAANSLDDYEEGTWTGAVMDGNTNGRQNITVNNVVATYRKIGKQVTCWFNITRNETGSRTGQIRFNNSLPFTSASGMNVIVTGTWWLDEGGVTSGDSVGGSVYVVNDSTQGVFVHPTNDSQQAPTRYLEYSQWSQHRPIYGSFTYYVD